MKVACMGGWCQRRERCPYYTSKSPTVHERLCVKGRDGYTASPRQDLRTAPTQWLRSAA